MPLNTITIPSELIEKITHDNCVVYVGAGLSMGAGLPNWQTLLENMIEWSLNHGVSFNNKADLKKMIREEKYLKVANIIVKRMGNQRFGEFLVSVFRKPGLRPTEAHLLLPKIPFVSVLTSNYDKLIESAYTIIRQGESVAVFTHSNNRDLAAVLSSKEFHILKTHGSIDDIETVVLSLEDYQKLMHSNELYRIYLEQLFTSKTVLFIGFSLADPDLFSILDGLQVDLKKITPPHYALLEERTITKSEAEELRETYNIHVLRYKASSSSHPEITEFLREITEKTPKKPLRQLAELKNNLDDIDTHYKIVATTEGKFEIYEKFPGASEEKPLTTSFTVIPDQETKEAIQRHIDTGEQLTINNQCIKDVILPELFYKLFNLDTSEITVVIGPNRSEKIIKTRLILQPYNGENVIIEDIELKNISTGKKQAIISNEHQNHIFNIKFILDYTYKDDFHSCKTDVSLTLDSRELNLRDQLLVDRYYYAICKGSKLYFENIETGTPLIDLGFLKIDNPPDHPKWVPILEALLLIQTATRTQFSVPRSLSDEEVKLILNIAYVIKNGISKGDVKYTVEVNTHIAQEILDKKPTIEFSTYSEEQVLIQGKRVNLGMSWITCNPVLSVDEQIRLREEIKKNPEQARHLAEFATTPENQALSYFFDFLSPDDFENLHANLKYRKFALDHLIKTLFEAVTKENEDVDIHILLSCFESAAKEVNNYGRPYNMLPRATVDELKLSLKTHISKLKNSQRGLLFSKLVELKIIKEEDIILF